MCSNRTLPAGAPAQDSVPADLSVWWAGHAARALFDAQTQTPVDRARWERLTNPRRRAEWEVSRALLTRALGSVAQPADASFSLSHSSDHAAVATSAVAERVGVDLEHVRERDFLRLARFAFSDGEHAQLETLAPTARAERFYFLWTLKEAFAKALSLPLLQSVSQCTFVDGGDTWRASVPTQRNWVARVFQPRPDFVLSVVALLPEPRALGKLRVELHEWPSAARPIHWRELAALSSSDEPENVSTD